MRKKYILSDKEILDLWDDTPLAEGDPLFYFDDNDEPECCFWSEAENVSKATAAETAKLKTEQARTLFNMRAFYFLGVLRGAEAYRAWLSDEDEMESIPFTLNDRCSEDAREAMEAMPPEVFQRLCNMLGMSAPQKEK